MKGGGGERGGVGVVPAPVFVDSRGESLPPARVARLVGRGKRSLYMPGSGLLHDSFVSLISFAAVTLLFAMMFKLLPQAKVAWADVWIGAAVTAGLFSAGRWLIVLYLQEYVYCTGAPLHW